MLVMLTFFEVSHTNVTEIGQKFESALIKLIIIIIKFIKLTHSTILKTNTSIDNFKNSWNRYINFTSIEKYKSSLVLIKFIEVKWKHNNTLTE